MQSILLIIQVVVSILMTVLILAQNKDGGLSAAMGGGQTFESVKRGPEKVIFSMTVFFVVLFLANALLMVIL